MTKLKKGDKVKVHYVGTIKEGQVFDSSRDKDQPIEFSIDDGKLLKGFNDAVKELEVGGKKTISLVSDEASGEDLKFEIELLEIVK